jgi:inosine/xanthosine triphosphate pyrophosphatase family protein
MQNCLAVVRCVVLDDDSGLREGAMQGLAGVMGQALAADPVAFAAR